jgi:hypothetical protein
MADTWQAARSGGDAAVVASNRQFYIAVVALARHGRAVTGARR